MTAGSCGEKRRPRAASAADRSFTQQNILSTSTLWSGEEAPITSESARFPTPSAQVAASHILVSVRLNDPKGPLQFVALVEAPDFVMLHPSHDDSGSDAYVLGELLDIGVCA